MAEIDKFDALGEVARMTKQLEQLDKERQNLAAVAAAQGATATELAAVLRISRTTAHRKYLG